MKNVFAMFVVLALSIFSLKAQHTNKNGVAEGFPPLPKAFSGLSQRNDIYLGLYPVAVYRLKDQAVNYLCVGTMFRQDTNSWVMLIPKHVFTKQGADDGDYSYAVRFARPYKSEIFGYITNVARLKSKNEGIDAVIAFIGKDKVKATVFMNKFKDELATASSNLTLFCFSPDIIVNNVAVTELYSLITGERVQQLGYTVDINPEELRVHNAQEGNNNITNKYPGIEIRYQSEPGYSGMVFFDQNKRLFLLRSKVVAQEHKSFMSDRVRYYLEFLYGEKINDTSTLVGPIEIERVNWFGPRYSDVAGTLILYFRS